MRTQSQHGFTLIELMITVVIIAILASIALPSYKNYIKKSKVQAGQSDLVGLALSAESRYQRQLSYPSGSLADATAIKAQFTTWGPTSTDFTYSYNSTDGTAYTLTATGNSTSPVASCILTLSNAGVKNITGCDPITQWTN